MCATPWTEPQVNSGKWNRDRINVWPYQVLKVKTVLGILLVAHILHMDVILSYNSDEQIGFQLDINREP